MKLGYNELGYSELSAIANKKLDWLVQVFLMAAFLGYNEHFFPQQMWKITKTAYLARIYSSVNYLDKNEKKTFHQTPDGPKQCKVFSKLYFNTFLHITVL